MLLKLDNIKEAISQYFSSYGLDSDEKKKFLMYVKNKVKNYKSNNELSEQGNNNNSDNESHESEIKAILPLLAEELSDNENQALFETISPYIQKTKNLIPEKEVVELLEDANYFFYKFDQKYPAKRPVRNHNVTVSSDSSPNESSSDEDSVNLLVNDLSGLSLEDSVAKPVASSHSYKKIPEKELKLVLAEGQKFMDKFDQLRFKKLIKDLTSGQKLALGDRLANNVAFSLANSNVNYKEFLKDIKEELCPSTPTCSC